MILIPSIDLRNGRCVRLLKGNFDAETRYDLEPHELLKRYRDLGATWLHVVDLDGAKDGRLANRSVIVRLASQKALNIQVGGGVRSVDVVDDLLRNGIDRVIVGSAAALAAPPVLAQGNWPSREIRLIVSVAPGGGADLVARQVAHVISQDTGGTVVVRNIVGGSGLLRYHLVRNHRIVPYVQAGFGGTWTDAGGLAGSPTSTQFNFITQVGMGSHIFLNKKWAIVSETSYVWIGNWGIGTGNGYHVLGGLAGITRYFK